MTTRRVVRRSSGFVGKAKNLFPPGGSTSGRASFELFEELVLRGVEEQFRRFEKVPVALEGVPQIRCVMTHAVPFFPALVVYGMLLSDDTVELVDLEEDPEYWDLIANDPDG